MMSSLDAGLAGSMSHLGLLETVGKLEAVDDECPAMVSGVYVEQDGRFISSVLLLSCHSSSFWEGLCFSGVSPDEPTAKKTELVKKVLFTYGAI